MINVVFTFCDHVTAYKSIQVSGHANYAPKGQDVVCASVSTATHLMASILERLDDDIDVNEATDGNTLLVNLPKAYTQEHFIFKICSEFEHFIRGLVEYFPKNVSITTLFE